jgi:hypothetical protein
MLRTSDLSKVRQTSTNAIDEDADEDDLVITRKKNLKAHLLAINKGESVKRLLYKNLDAEFVFPAGDDKVCYVLNVKVLLLIINAL